jgi:phage tail-like protein
MKQNEIETLLPSVFQRTALQGGPLYALLGVMETLHAQPEAILENLEAYFDPYRCPDAFVPYLANWVDLERFLPYLPQTRSELSTFAFPPGLGRLRELILAAVFLSKWRGTALGLRVFLETATGITGFEIDEQVYDENGEAVPFRVRVRAPAAARKYEALVRRIIALEKPAYVTCIIAFMESADREDPAGDEDREEQESPVDGEDPEVLDDPEILDMDESEGDLRDQ